MRIRFSKPQRKQKYLENKTSSYSSVKTKFCFYLQPNYPLPRTAIEVEILYQALYVLSTTLEHEFDEMSNITAWNYVHPWTIVKSCGFWKRLSNLYILVQV